MTRVRTNIEIEDIHDDAADFHAAGRVYRTCRRAGVTPRGLIDCMIASVALRHSATLLAHDAI